MAAQPDVASALYDLAARLGVGIGEACDRAGIARSTPPRWKSGTTPRPQQATRLRQAVLAIARERGTLPVDHPPGDVAPETEPIPADQAAELRRWVSQEHAEIKAVLAGLLAQLARIEKVLAELALLSFIPMVLGA